MSAGKPPTESSSASVIPKDPEDTVTQDDQENQGWFASTVRKMEHIMPLWAWVLAIGAIFALLFALLAGIMMNNLDVGKDSLDGDNTTISPSHPAATTTGKWDKEPEIGGGDGSYGTGYDPNYVPQAPLSTVQENTKESAPSSEKKKPEESKPAESSQPSNPSPPPASTNPSPDPLPTQDPVPTSAPGTPVPNPAPGGAAGRN